MNNLLPFAQGSGIIWLLLLIGAVLVRLFNGSIKRTIVIRKPARDDLSHGNDPIRIQVLFITIVGALYYLNLIVANPTAFPDVPPTLLVAFSVSHGLYVGERTYSWVRIARLQAHQ